ncbi:MAG: hypothetical protein KAG61_06065 [Bacteriovoracaceae bacterium]|nr:hypothetical protein [Bacteriovoracaceae bacterium]
MASNLDGKFKTDKDFEKSGIWIAVNEEVEFRVSRFGGFNAPAIKKAIAKYHKPHTLAIKAGRLPAEEELLIMTKVFVESSITDWKGVEVDGEVVDFSISACVDLLSGLPDLTEVLMKEASEQENYREELGNS